MKPVALVTGADRGLGLALCAGLLDRGWRVFAGQYLPDWPDLANLKERHSDALEIVPLDVGSSESVWAAAESVGAQTDRLDLVVSNAGIGGGSGDPREGLDTAAILRAHNVNTLGAIRIVEAFLPLADRGGRRLAFVSSEAGSVALSFRTSGFGYCMSKTALNMAVQIMFNDLRPEGYTLRLYHPGWMRSYMSGKKGTHADIEPEESAARAIPFFLEDRLDEDRLVMIDYEGREWPF